MITFKNHFFIVLLFILITQVTESAETPAATTQMKPPSTDSSALATVVDSSSKIKKIKQIPQKTPIHLLVTRAGEAASLDEVENGWFSAVLEGYYNLRFQPFMRNFITRDNYKQLLSKSDDFGVSIPENDIFRIARTLNATHILLHTYDFENSTVNYYLEVVSVDKKNEVMSFDKSFPFENLEQNLLECTGLLIEKLKFSYPKELIKPIRRPIFSPALDNIEYLGDLIIEYNKKHTLKTADKFLKIVEKDPSSALAVYMAALAHRELKDYKQTTHLFNQLIIRNGFWYPQLYVESSKLLRLSESFDQSQRILAHAQKQGLKTPELLLEKAKTYEASKLFDKALSVYGQVLELNPRQPEALFFFAHQKRKDGLHKESMDILTSLNSSKINPGKLNLEKGENLIALGKDKEALHVLLLSLKTLPDDPRVNELLGDINYRLKRYRDAAIFYKKAFENNSFNLGLLIKTSNAYKKSNNAEQALTFLNKYKADFYNSKLVTKEIGLIKFLLKDTANAISILETCINIEPPDSNVYLALGDIYMSKGLHEDAISMYSKAEDLVKDKFRIKLALSNLYFTQKNYLKAEQGFLSILSTNPKYPHANQSLADIYYIKGKKQDALRYYLNERSYNASNIRIQKRIGQIYYEQKDYVKSSTEFKKLISMAPSDPFAYYQLTRIALDQKKVGEARNYFEKGEKKGTADILTYKKLGEGFAQAGSINHAIKSYKNGLQLDPGNEGILIDLGKIYEKAGRYNDAAQIYMNVYNLNKTKNISYLAEAGHLFFKTGKKDEAYGAYRDVIEKGYRKPDVAINMATMEFEKKKYERVIPLLTNLDKNYLAEKKIASMLAFSYYFTDNYKFAIPHIKVLLSKSPSKEIVEMAAFLYEKTGQLHEAISMYNKYLSFEKTDKHKKYAYHIALLYEKLKDFSSAKAQYIKNLKVYPDDFRNYKKVVHIFIKENMYSQAISYLQKVIEKPDCPPEFFKILAELYAKQKKGKEAAAVLQRYSNLKPDETDALLTLGTTYYSMKLFSKAIVPLEKYHNIHPNDTACLNMLASSLINTGNISKATSIYNKIIIKNPNNENSLIKLSELYSRNKKMVEVAKIYKKLFQINKSKNSAYLSKAGHIYYDRSKYSEASEHYSMYLNSGYRDSKVSINLAAIEFKNKNYQKVITLLTGIPDKDISEKEVIRQLVTSYKNTGKEDQALPYIKKLITKDSRDIKNIEIAAIIFEKNGDLTSAIAMYKKFLASPRTESHKDYAYHLAELYEKQKAKSMAMSQYLKNIALYPNDLRNYKKLSQYYEKEKKYDQAAKILTKARNIPSAPPGVTKKLAEILVLQKKMTQAALEYEKYVKQVTNDHEAWYSLGTIYYSLKKYKNALLPLEKALSLKPANRPGLYKLGYSYIKANFIKKALKPLQEALRLAENDTEVLKLLTLCYTHVKDTASLISVLQTRAEIAKKDFQLYFQLGELLLKTRKNEHAIQWFEKALTIKPKDISTHLNLITLYTKVNNKSKLIAHIDQVLQFAPKSPDIHFKKALFHIDLNEIANAKVSLKKTIQLKPDNHIAHFKYAELLEKDKNFKTAYNHFYQAAKYDGKNIEYLMALARISEITGKISFAVNTINKALKLQPGNAKVVQSAGFIYYKSGQKKKAVDLLLQGIELDENCPFCYEIIGTLYYSKKDYIKASTYLEKATQLNNKSDRLFLQYANSLYFQGKYKQAQTYYSKTFTINPENDEALYRLCATYVLEKETGKAELIFKNNLRTKKSGWIHLTEACIYKASNKISEAYKSYILALKAMPKNIEALIGLGDVSILQKKYNSAIKYFSQAMIIRPEDTEIFIGLGKAYYYLKNYTAALELFLEISKKAEGKVELYHMMGLTYSKLKKHSAAINILKKGLKIKERDADLQFTLGMELRNNLQFEESIRRYLKAIKYDKTKAVNGYLAIGNIYYYKLKSTRNAKRYYTKYVKAGGTDSKIKSLLNSL